MAAASSSLKVGGSEYEIFRLDALQATHDVARLPFTLRILLENALRTGTEADVEAVAGWVATDEPSRELSFTPARVLHQDFTGVPAVVDLVAMRDAMRDLGGDPARIDPELPSNLVIDHSVQVDAFASRGAMARNTELEFERNRERYAFLRFGQQAFDGLTVVPPATGIVHQVNLEFLARVVQDAQRPGVSRTRCSAPTRTRRWSTASACSAGASAASRPRRRCSARPSRCSCRRWSASG